jgi:hypothetical protein
MNQNAPVDVYNNNNNNNKIKNGRMQRTVDCEFSRP